MKAQELSKVLIQTKGSKTMVGNQSLTRHPSDTEDLLASGQSTAEGTRRNGSKLSKARRNQGFQTNGPEQPPKPGIWASRSGSASIYTKNASNITKQLLRRGSEVS